MTHKILDHDTQKRIYQSAVRPKKSSTPNHRLAPHGGEVSASSDPSEDKIFSGSPLGSPEGSSLEQKAPTVFIRSRDEENPSGSKPMPTFDPSDLIGRTFLLPDISIILLFTFYQPVTYMFGYHIPRNYMEAMQFGSENKNSKWYDAIKVEMESMLEYKVFNRWDKAILDKHKKVKNSCKGYHRIKFHLVFAVKFDGRHKARLVADGHLTPEPKENIYSGVVSLRNLRLVIFLGKLNNLELWGADIGNAYLEAFTDEKLYIVAGPEFQELEGYILIFLKALYGLKSSGKRWAEVIHSILRDMKFLPSKADPCIWLKKAPNLKCYEYIAVYVDDLCIAAESPSAIIQIFKSKYHLKVKDNRILSKVQKSFWSCTHVNSCQKYILYINLHILLNSLS